MADQHESVGGGDPRSLGGQLLVVQCSRCRHDVEIVDHRFLERGPVRCGACGAEVRGSLLPRLLEDAFGAEGG